MSKAKRFMVMGLMLLMFVGVGFSSYSNTAITPFIDPPSGNPNRQ